jgi:hypothetical protein
MFMAKFTFLVATLVVLPLWFLVGISGTYIVLTPAQGEEVCYGPSEGQLVTPTSNVSVVVSVFHWQENHEMIQVLFDDPMISGASACEIQEDKNIAFCDHYVVMPKYVYGDPAMDTIGHEVLHGAFGSYHSERTLDGQE